MTNIVFRPKRVIHPMTFNPLYPSQFIPRPAIKNDVQNPHYSKAPLSNIKEFENKYEIQLAMPGFTKEMISIQLEENKLIITSENNDIQERSYLKRDINFNKMSRSFILPENANVDDISAEMINGVLNVSITKRAEPQPIEVKIK